MDITPYTELKIAPRAVFDTLEERKTRVRFMLPTLDGDWRSVTWGAFAAQIRKASLFLGSVGLTTGDRAAIFAPNRVEWIAAALAIQAAGAAIVPIYAANTTDQAAYVAKHCDAKVLFVDTPALLGRVFEAWDEYAAASKIVLLDDALDAQKVLEKLAAAGKKVPASAEVQKKLVTWSEALAIGAARDAEDPTHFEKTMHAVSLDQVGMMLYTSGTESRPKGALLSARCLYSHYTSCIIDGEMSSDDVEVHSLPLYHCAQLDCFLTPDIYLGATSIVLAKPDPGTLLRTIQAERVTKIFCPPTVWISLLGHPDFDTTDLSSLAKGYYGASIMPVEVLKELSARLPRVRLFNFYGQTEMSPVATILKPEDQMRKPGSAGRPALNVETCVVDDDDRPVPPGVVGEIVHRGPHATLGYWKNPEKTAEAFRNGWFHSGDLGVIDDEGYLSVVDRKKDMIKTGGENVASREVEEMIFTHPAVSEVAVFGVLHPRWIEAVMAVVVLRPGHRVSEEEVLHFCRERMASYKAPKFVEIIDDLPKNASGKILKRELRERFAHRGKDLGAD